VNRLVKIGGATLNQTPFDWHRNVANILAAIDAAKKEDVKILCLPELCLTGYGCEDVFLSDWLSEKAFQHLLAIVPHTENICVSIGMPIRMNKITYNGAALVQNKKILGVTLKQNLARDGVHYEPRWFDAWQADEVRQLTIAGKDVQVGDIIYEVENIKLGFEICEDSWRKEKRPGYRLQERGVDLILNPSASHFAFGKSLLRENEVVVDGSIKFNCAYLFVNVLGNEAGRMVYDGDIIIAQKGKVIRVNNRLSFRNFNLISASINFDSSEKTEAHPYTDDKEKNGEFARAASLALFDYLRKSRAKGYVLSLSGGADSSCCAVLVAEMVRRGSHELGFETFCKELSIPFLSTEKEIVRQLLSCKISD
jgi:NAD+ synthase (glutamine-hydrolysing)